MCGLRFILGKVKRRELALEYRAAHLGYRPASMRDSAKKRTKKAKSKYNAPHKKGALYRLSQILECPRLYVVDASLLRLSKATETAEAIYTHSSVDLWRGALQLAFEKPWYAVLEVDSNGRLHAHVVAEAKAHRELEGQILETTWEQFATYISKPCDARGNARDMDSKLEAEGLYLESKKSNRVLGKKTPRKIIQFGIPQK